MYDEKAKEQEKFKMHFSCKKVLDSSLRIIYSKHNEEKAMKEDNVKRDYFWIVEAVAPDGYVIMSRRFKNFDSACEKYDSVKNAMKNATVSLERSFKEYKIA